MDIAVLRPSPFHGKGQPANALDIHYVKPRDDWAAMKGYNSFADNNNNNMTAFLVSAPIEPIRNIARLILGMLLFSAGDALTVVKTDRESDFSSLG